MQTKGPTSVNPFANPQTLQQVAAPSQTAALQSSAGVSRPVDQLVSAKQVADAYYKEMLERYQKQKSGKLSRWGRMMLESLISLYPSISDTLEQPFFEDEALGVLTGRTILSLVKEGAQRRPNSVLTTHYMAELLGVYDETPKINVLKPQSSIASDRTESSLVEKMDSPQLQEALNSVIEQLEKTGLIWQEKMNETALLHPYSEKKLGEESLFDWLMQRRQAQQSLSNDQIRAQFSEAISQFNHRRYLMEVIYFQDQTFKGITGWDLLALILKAQQALPGDTPVDAIHAFFDESKRPAVDNGISDLADKLGLITLIEKTDDVQGQRPYIMPQPYAEYILMMRSERI